jgi:hypothetical protein
MYLLGKLLVAILTGKAMPKVGRAICAHATAADFACSVSFSVRVIETAHMWVGNCGFG